MFDHTFRMRPTQPLLCRAVSSIRPLTRTTWMAKRRSISIVPPPWRPASVLDKYEPPPSYHLHANNLIFVGGLNEKQDPSVYASLPSLDVFLPTPDYLAQLIMFDSSFLPGDSTHAKHTLHAADSTKELRIVFATCKHYLMPLW